MRRLSILSAAMAALLSVSVASAQTPATAQGSDAGRLDSKTRRSNVRVSQLMGANFRTAVLMVDINGGEVENKNRSAT